MKHAKVWLVVLSVILLSGHVYAQTNYYVKQTGRADSTGRDSWTNAVDTIQRAMDRVRADGVAGLRIIHVAAGNYEGSITLDAGIDNVYLFGGYPAAAVDGDTRNGAVNGTTIRCGGGCTAVTIQGVSSAAIEGFIIQGGGTYGGDGVRVDNSISVMVSRNRIQDCIGGSSHGIRWSQSGGSISSNTISNNEVGSGIYINQVREGCGGPRGICQVVVIGNRITGNYANNGGGILVANMWSDEEGYRSPCIIACNSIESNEAGNGGGIRIADGSGIRIRRNAVRSNIFSSHGGGISLLNTVGSFIEENVITENTNRAASSGRGAGISFEESRAIVSRNIITSNRCNGEGDGIYIFGNSHVPSIGNRLVSPSGGSNCIHGNSDRDLFYSGAIPGEVWAQNNFWNSADRRFIAGRIRGIDPTHWWPIVASCPLSESSLLLDCFGHDCTIAADPFRGCLSPTR
jgi:hypothetical protein